MQYVELTKDSPTEIQLQAKKIQSEGLASIQSLIKENCILKEQSQQQSRKIQTLEETVKKQHDAILGGVGGRYSYMIATNFQTLRKDFEQMLKEMRSEFDVVQEQNIQLWGASIEGWIHNHYIALKLFIGRIKEDFRKFIQTLFGKGDL